MEVGKKKVNYLYCHQLLEMKPVKAFFLSKIAMQPE